jgi:hypothetical protein
MNPAYYEFKYPFFKHVQKKKKTEIFQALNLLEIIKHFYKKKMLNIFFIERYKFKKLLFFFKKNNKRFSIRRYFNKVDDKKYLITIINNIYILFNNMKFFSKKFYYNIYNYKKYLYILNNEFKSKIVEIKPTILQKASILRDKHRRLEFFDDRLSTLYGYKFHFVGRFTRKQQSANLWFVKGAVPKSSAAAIIDYGTATVILQYSICNIKV